MLSIPAQHVLQDPKAWAQSCLDTCRFDPVIGHHGVIMCGSCNGLQLAAGKVVELSILGCLVTNINYHLQQSADCWYAPAKTNNQNDRVTLNSPESLLAIAEPRKAQ